ncbi:transcription elongation factor A protein 2 isoform X2 [Monodon monoceros]|uniref:transcription elongation factor A protein 2 isoform X2 n=1 Tax=Monodon monoceros TaxID=40151 RepID=UPI0010F917E5|nr:transcription elongation factor A protein 2 isoform X2 [Monodon monoceros]
MWEHLWLFPEMTRERSCFPSEGDKINAPQLGAEEGAMDLLRELKAMPVTLHLLQSTRVGMSVNALRKQSSDEEVVTLAKSLIKSWKKLLDASDAKARERRRGGPLPTSSSKEASEAQDPSRKRPELPRTPSTPRITTFPPVPVTCDAVRNKCREMLTAALQTDHDHVAVGADCERLSAQIEEYILCAAAWGLQIWRNGGASQAQLPWWPLSCAFARGWGGRVGVLVLARGLLPDPLGSERACGGPGSRASSLQLGLSRESVSCRRPGVAGSSDMPRQRPWLTWGQGWRAGHRPPYGSLNVRTHLPGRGEHGHEVQEPCAQPPLQPQGRQEPQPAAQRAVRRHHAAADRRDDLGGDGQRRAEGDPQGHDQGGHPRAPDGAHGRHADRPVHLRQVQEEELHLHAGADPQLR